MSLESALAFYHLIPETVYQVTSVTTQKPGQFDTPEGSFRHRHLKPDLYFGFESIHEEHGLPMLMASPEKALLDFFYFNLARFSINDPHVFEESYRLQANDALQLDRLQDYATRFASKKLMQVVDLFVNVHFDEYVHA